MFAHYMLFTLLFLASTIIPHTHAMRAPRVTVTKTIYPSLTPVPISGDKFDLPGPTTPSSSSDPNDPVAWANDILPRFPTQTHSPTPSHPHSSPPPLVPPHAPWQSVRDEDEPPSAHPSTIQNVDESQCVLCNKHHGSIVCIGSTHYGFCDEGCAKPMRLKEGSKCVEGRIYGDKVWKTERVGRF